MICAWGWRAHVLGYPHCFHTRSCSCLYRCQDSARVPRKSRRMVKIESGFVDALLKSLPKPVPATEQRLAQLPDPYVTIKLDGVRALLWQDGSGTYARTLSECFKISDTGAEYASVFDTEQVRDHFYVFDALFVLDVDVRHLPLAARLRCAAAAIPSCAVLKRFFWGPEPSLTTITEKLALSRPRLADGSRLEALEGFIFGSMAAPYNGQSFKFKFGITCDFLVTDSSPRVRGAPRELLLHVLRAQDLVVFRESKDVPCTVLITPARATDLGLPEIICAADCIILARRPHCVIVDAALRTSFGCGDVACCTVAERPSAAQHAQHGPGEHTPGSHGEVHCKVPAALLLRRAAGRTLRAACLSLHAQSRRRQRGRAGR